MNGYKSKDLFATLHSEICSGKYASSGAFPSERALVRRFHAARETVRSALRELEKQHLIRRKVGCGTTVIAGKDHRRRFAVIVPDIFYPFYSRIVRGIETGLEQKFGAGGYSLLVAALDREGSASGRVMGAKDFAEVCVRENVAGVFFQPFQFLRSGEKVNRAILDVLRNARIPVILLDSDFLTPPQRSEYDLVGIDNVHVGYLLGRHVIERGAKRIWYFSNPLPAPTSLKRADGVAMAVTEAGLRWRRDSVFFADPADTRAARRVFAGSNSPDAIVAVNDHVASILLRTLESIGKRVPNDVLLCGVNGDPVSMELSPHLTTVVQPCARIGEGAVELLLQRLKDPSLPARELLLASHLEVRESTLAGNDSRCSARKKQVVRQGKGKER